MISPLFVSDALCQWLHQKFHFLRSIFSSVPFALSHLFATFLFLFFASYAKISHILLYSSTENDDGLNDDEISKTKSKKAIPYQQFFLVCFPYFNFYL